MTYFVGIDPGQKGAVAVIDKANKILLLKQLPEPSGYAKLFFKDVKRFCDASNTFFAIEKVWGMGGESRSANTTFLKNYGMLLGVISSLTRNSNGNNAIEVSPMTWQAIYKDNPIWIANTEYKIARKKQKKRSFEMANFIYPPGSVYYKLLGPRGGILDGKSDALLIANWCRSNIYKE